MTDRLTVLVVVIGLAVIGLAGLAAAALLLWAGVDASKVAMVTSLAGPAVGGLTGILASTRTAPAP